MNWKVVGSIAVGIVAASVVVVGFAASGGSGPGGAAEETPTVTAEAVPTETEEAVATVTVEASATATDTGETPTPVVSATATQEADDGQGPRDVTGIPDDNPNFAPDDDGDCEHGETRVKTTPGGHQVNVPCHAAEHSDDPQEGHSDHSNAPHLDE